MKECKYCRTKYNDSLSVCPNCGGTKVVTVEELAEESAYIQREAEYREKANAALKIHKKRVVAIMGAGVAIIVVAIALISINANKPLSNGMSKDEGKEVLASGIEYYDKGDYEAAIDCFLQLPPDSKQYEEAQSMLNKSAEAYREYILNKADRYIQSGEYEVALELLKKAQTILPEDTELVNAYNSAFGSYKEQITNTTIAEANEYASDGNYESAIKSINMALDKVGQDEELEAKRTVFYNEYKSIVFQSVDKAFDEGGYENAYSLLNSYQSFFSNDSEFNEKVGYYETLKPVSLFSLTEYAYSQTWATTYYPSCKDALGKSHDDVYINSGASYGLAPGAASAVYYIESGYKSLTGEIAYKNSSGSGYIEILSGDTVIYTSPLVRGTDGSIPFSVDISGVDFLGITVNSGKDSWWDCNDVMLIGLTLHK